MGELPEVYRRFWRRAWGLSDEDIRSARAQVIQSGRYLEKFQDQYIFIYHDLISGKRLLAASQTLQARQPSICRLQTLEQNQEQVAHLMHEAGWKLSFDDRDYGLLERGHFKPSSVDGIVPLTAADSLEEFYGGCSEDDKDTLDLTFENEAVFARMADGRIQAVSRHARLPQTQLVDLTVVTRVAARGQGHARALVAAVIQDALSKGLHPRYRVKDDNVASRRIAEALGLLQTHRVQAWEKG